MKNSKIKGPPGFFCQKISGSKSRVNADNLHTFMFSGKLLFYNMARGNDSQYNSMEKKVQVGFTPQLISHQFANKKKR